MDLDFRRVDSDIVFIALIIEINAINIFFF